MSTRGAVDTKTYDVLIAGAGPVGLLLACELGLAGGLSVAVLERDPDYANYQSPWKQQPLGVRGINTLSAESFHRRGLLEQVIGPEEWAKRPMDVKSTGRTGHFAGMMFDAAKVNRSAPCWKYKLPGPSLCPSPSSLGRIQEALYQRAKELDVEIIGGVDVTALAQDEEHGTVEVHTKSGHSYRSKWVVGCDGARSNIRKAAGIDMVGTEPEIFGWTVLCNLDDPNKRLKFGFTRTSTGVYGMMLPGHIFLMEPTNGEVYDRTKELTKEEFEVIVRRVTGIDNVSVKDIQIASTFTDRAKQAVTYKSGRVLLAGDSAHFHSPLGGQGLNAGIGDAMNLGWKLAAVVKGSVPLSLLDTYQKERYPVGEWITEWTRAQVATMKPDLQSRAVANLMKDLIGTSDGATHMTDRFWGLSQRYDLNLGDDEQQHHDLVGRSVPDFEFTSGSDRLGERMYSGHGQMLYLGQDDRSELVNLAQRWSSSVEYVSEPVKDNLGFRALLIRPDGVVAWVTEDGSEPDVNSAEAALHRWFGPGAEVGTK
ncbi:FAD binding domain-containing protein [Truncatella angustata]|uniref:FAD binding domain-containing protein n=1 Tax=Truncatella angustata TaxID=152316 RepID=A0A9P8UVH0_9PEZI|nr:FAD binding domain-containing protein [Truncatella angustata]KAH6659080.1 FAD binding domain-containing protein [Truncatella angustata]KAH8201230.1 hypothetical protein TruAng_004620 [Truncatella angustata]